MNSLDRMSLLQKQANPNTTVHLSKQQEELDNNEMEQAIEAAIEHAGDDKEPSFAAPDFDLEAEIDKEVAYEQDNDDDGGASATPPHGDAEDEGLASLDEDAAAWEAGLQEELSQEALESPTPLTPTCTPTGQGRTSRALRIRENVAAWREEEQTQLVTKKASEPEKEEEEEEALAFEAKIAEEAAEALPQESQGKGGVSIEDQIDDAIDLLNEEDETACTNNHEVPSSAAAIKARGGQRRCGRRSAHSDWSEEENQDRQIAANVMKEMVAN